MATKMEMLGSLQELLKDLPLRDFGKVDELRGRARMILTRVFGKSSSYLTDLEKISFSPTVAYQGMPDSDYDEAWDYACIQTANLFNTACEELRLTESEDGHATNAIQPTKSAISSKIFVVHGHDNEMKVEVARVLEKLGLEPIILHEQPDKGRTVIEKFMQHSEVGFAVVLFSPDDMAYQKDAHHGTARSRARQNVVLELGFFVGKLGRERVLVLHRNADNFDMPRSGFISGGG